MADSRKRPRWDIDASGKRVRRNYIGPALPGGQYYSRSQQAMADPRNARVLSAPQRGYERSGGYYGRFSGPSAELKFFDTALSFGVDATGEVPATGQLVLIPQGVTESTRVGRKATIKSIQMKFLAQFAPGAAATAASHAFVYLVQDTQCNGAAAAITDVLTGTNMSAALINLANSGRFKIIKKWKARCVSTAGATTAYNNTVQHFEWYKKCSIPIEYSSTTGAITEIRSNNLFLLAGSDTASDDTITIGGTCRVRFSDT